MTSGVQAVSRISRDVLGIPDEKARYLLQCDLIIKKVNTLVLPLMRKHDIDMWLTLDREYNPDPFAQELGGQGGVRNAHIFFDTGDRLEKIFIFSHPPREDLAPRLYDEMKGDRTGHCFVSPGSTHHAQWANHRVQRSEYTYRSWRLLEH
jgi:hypothetical protein